MPQTNGVAERAVQDLLDGARGHMVHAGLPAYFWSYAAPCYCLLRNTRLVEGHSATAQSPVVDHGDDPGGQRYSGDGRFLALPSMRRPRVLHEDGDLPQNPWALRHEEELTGRRIPFGCGVYFKPALTKYSVDEACARARFGIFLGYRLSPGCRWNGEYLVGDLSDFVDLDLCEDASARGVQIYEHVTKVVSLPAIGIAFPLKARYDFLHVSLEEARFARHGEGVLPEVPGSDHEGVATSGDTPAVEDAPGALGDIPPPEETGGDDLVPILDEAGEVVHWGIDARGRRYRVDEFGHKIATTGTTRPPGYPVDEWKPLSVQQRERVIAEYRESKETLARASRDSPAA